VKHYLVLFLLVLATYSWAVDGSSPTQKQLSGQIFSKNDAKSIPYATITLQLDSAHVLIRKSTDSDGKFLLTISGHDTIQFIATAIGYQSLLKTIHFEQDKFDLGDISLETGVIMKTVTVNGQKPLVKVDPDKITYSVESDPEAKTSNGLEILRKVPLLDVDGEENVTLNGQSNFKVLVNGKSSSMMSKNFKDVIKSLPANSIKDIEVITNPSTKYESEGVGGIINIITHKKTLNGYNGSISGGLDNWGSFNGSVYLATKVNKFGFSGMYSGNQSQRPPTESNSYSENSNSDIYHFTESHSRSNNSSFSQQFSGEISYEIDTFNLISGSFWGYLSNNRNNSHSTNRVESITNSLSQYFSTQNKGSYGYGSVSGNLDYQKTFMKPDKSLTFSYKFDLSPQSNENTNQIDSSVNYQKYKQRNEGTELSQEHTMQMDFYDPLTKMHQYEWGIKFIYRGDDDNSDRWRNDTLRSDLSNRLQYDQFILGAYGGYVFKWEKLTAKSGFRLERTWNEGLSKSDSTVRFDNRLFNLVPYISFSYQFKPSQTLKASYTQRLQRPGVYYLNPYVENSNPLYISYGNPNLKSEVSHAFELGYSIYNAKFSWNTSLSASYNNNSIEQVSKIDSMGVTTSTYDNIGLDERYRWNNYLSYRQGTKFNIYTSFTGSYSKFASNNGMGLHNEGFNFSMYGGAQVSLWKNANISGNIGYYSPSVYLQGKSAGYSYSSLSFGQYLLDRKLRISFSASDPFLARRYSKGEQNGMGYKGYYEYWYYSRTFRLNLSYNFGKLDTAVKKARRGISNDDVKSGSSN
jgi:outer membrane receptor protein involved in Fe transport